MRESALGRARRAERARSRSAWREAVLERDGFHCRMYGVDLSEIGLADDCDGPLTAHHVLPISRGGKDELGNGLTLCHHHHLDVVHRHPEWAYERGYLLRTPPQPLHKPTVCACGHASADHTDWQYLDGIQCSWGCRASICIAGSAQ